MQTVLTWISDHPALIWPIVSGLLSFGLPLVEKRFPAFARAFRASGLDVAGLIKLLREVLGGKK